MILYANPICDQSRCIQNSSTCIEIFTGYCEYPFEHTLVEKCAKMRVRNVSNFPLLHFSTNRSIEPYFGSFKSNKTTYLPSPDSQRYPFMTWNVKFARNWRTYSTRRIAETATDPISKFSSTNLPFEPFSGEYKVIQILLTLDLSTEVSFAYLEYQIK